MSLPLPKTHDESGRMSVLIVNPKYRHDKGINRAGKTDSRLAKEMFKSMAEEAGMKCDVVQVSGKKISEKKLQKWVKKQEKATPSAAVLYYSGHGIQDQKSPWPQLQVRKHKLISSQKLMRQLEKTGAPLTVSCLEACNCIIEPKSKRKHVKALDKSLITSARTLEKVEKKCKAHPKIVKEGVKALLRDKGHIRVAAASPGEASSAICVGSHGESPFTVAMAAAVSKTCLKGKGAKWKNALKKVSAAMKGTGQTPLFKVKEGLKR